MKILLISNALTPHQIALCEAFNSNQEVNFKFIEAKEMVRKKQLPIGWRFLGTPEYLITNEHFTKEKDKFQKEIDNADVVIIGGYYPELISYRLENNKLTFIYSERIYKNLKQILKFPYHLIKFNKVYGRKPNLFLLSAGAFAYKDYKRLGCFKNRIYKWGYFIDPPSTTQLESIQSEQTDRKTRILWASRLIEWKHPELPVQMAKELKKQGYLFEINMYGVGSLREYISGLINEYDLAEYVKLCGEISNEDLQQEMREHDIFLFTSDKGEGWGVVANEAMANKCALVCSDKIGAATYLIEDGTNGLIFNNKSLKSLINKVSFLIDNPDKRIRIATNANKILTETWSPRNAAINFIKLVNDITANRDCTIQSGPCSKA